jgi:hypothetical protein
MLEVTEALRAQLESGIKTPQIVLEIEGLPSFSSVSVGKYPVYGDEIYYGDEGLYYGGTIEDDSVLPWISLEKSTNQISQQILPDKGGFSSITNFDVFVIDKDQRVSEMIKPGNLVDDVLGLKAKLYLCFEGAGHPHDSILFFAGIVTGTPVGAGYVKFNLSSAERLKNLEIFPKVSCVLTGAALVGDTTFTVDSTSDFLEPASGLRTYLIAGDEYIEYTGKTATTFTGLSRAQYDTIAAAYDAGQNIESAYRITGSLKDLCLKIMLSGINTAYLEDEQILGINVYGSETIENAIFVNDYFFKRNKGVVAGDSLTMVGTDFNDMTTEVVEVVQLDSGISYIVVSDALTTEGNSGTFSLTSQFAVWPKFAGLEMTPDQVDVAEFIDKDAKFSSQWFEYDFFIKEAVKGSDFINEQILSPSGCYSIPRNAKTSLGVTAPPIANQNVVTLDEYSVIGASGIEIERSNQNFYNAVIYKYDKDEVTEKFKRGKIVQSSNSTNRIRVANKPLVIEADGVRSPNFATKATILSNKALNRYQYGAEALQVQVNFGVGFPIEIGDVVILKGANLKISDSTRGDRQFKPRLFEVQNKTVKLTGQPILLKLVDTAFGLNGRYGVFSPSSKCDTGSTTTVLRLKKSYSTLLGSGYEGDKYKGILGAKIRVRSEDHTFAEDRYLESIDPANKNGIILASALSTPPDEDYIIEIAPYSSSADSDDEALTKTLFCNFDAQIAVSAGVSTTQFDIDSGDLSKIAVGATVYLHDDDYTNTSPEVSVTDITGTRITVSDSLGFTADNTYKVELNSYPDGGQAYRWY